MNRLDDRHDLDLTDGALRYLAARLRIRSVTRPFVQPVHAALDRARAADDAWRMAHAARLAAGAEIDYCDDQLDAQVQRLADELRGYLGCQREDPRFVALIPMAPAVAMAGMADDEQTAFVRSVLAAFEAQPELARAFRDHLETIRRVQADLEDALERRAELHDAEALERSARSMAVESARRMYNITHARLSLAIDDPDLLDSFFLPTE